MHRGGDLLAVADDPGVAEQPLDVGSAETGDLLRVEAGEHPSITFPFVQHGAPAQSGLGALQREELEDRGVIMQGYPPLLVVVGDHERVVARPRTTARSRLIGHGSPPCHRTEGDGAD